MSALRLTRMLLVLFALFLPAVLSAKDSPEDLLRHLPKTIAGCERGVIRDYGAPELGCSVGYKVPGLLITVYIYDLGNAHVADGLGDRLIADAMALAKKEIQRSGQTGDYTKVEFRDEARVNFDGGYQTLRARYYLTRNTGDDKGLEVFSEIHVFGARDQIIKFRISGEKDREEELSKVVKEFIPALMKALAPVKEEA
jgi:hypothetical protein